eukprot:TRINITY_DN5639_c0_g1_i1.p1 TRINITY_DN5639_c0_g1~~TRINITY_DN5639_c0_g1_i1.p1  ORF type:complete len:371 (-),score=50.49 TRINITY_DN5639_c0_g1_i1:57-1148(-)
MKKKLIRSGQFGPRIIGPKDFERIRLLGQGAVGKVYLVKHKESQKLFALKVLVKEEMILKKKQGRVLEERNALFKMKNHPFIVQLYGAFQTPERIYFVLEYCAGGPLSQYLERQPNKCLSEEEARFFAAELVSALEFIHLFGFIYRDLKTENVLITESGHIKLTDFDLVKQGEPIAEFIKGHVVAQTRTLANSYVGTMEYVAPEVIGTSGYTTAVDWWTLGVLLFEMLYGITPFYANTQGELNDRILHGKFSFPKKINRQPVKVSDHCKKLIESLLTVDPLKRLGNKGAAEVQAHPFFANIKFPLLKKEERPKPLLLPTHSDDRGDEDFVEDSVHEDDVSPPWNEFKTISLFQTTPKTLNQTV